MSKEEIILAIDYKRDGISFGAYLILDQNSSDVKYEYINGYAVAMAGGTYDHSALGASMVHLLTQEPGKQGPCRVLSSDMRVKLKNHCFYPDAVVTCDIADRGDALYISSPHLVVEVLSPSTELFDRTQKFKYYQEALTLKEYVLVNYRYQLVEVFHRNDDDAEWRYRSYGVGEIVELASLDIQVAVDDLYEGLDIPVEIPFVQEQ